MQNIGDRLTEARKRLGIALREASESTKIRTDYLQEMEGGTFDFSLPEVYKKGFLKIYARYLKLDADKLATDFSALYSDNGRGGRRDEREHLGRVEVPGGTGQVGGAAAAAAARESDAADKYAANQAQSQAATTRLVIGGGIVAVIAVLIFAGLNHLLNSSSTTDTSDKIASTSEVGNSTSGNSTSGNATSNAIAPNLTIAPPSRTVTLPATKLAGLVLWQLTFQAKDNITNLTVWQDSDHSVLYNAAVKKGASVSLTSKGKVEISVTQTENLIIKTNGGIAQIVADSNGKQIKGLSPGFLWPPGAQ